MAQSLNANADIIGRSQALAINCNAAKALQALLRSNLGPRGTAKMLVSGAGMIKVTKDGKALLDEIPLMHPTAALLARQATAQDDETGDGTTSAILFTGELLSGAERICGQGLKPRVLADGFEAARKEVLNFLQTFKTPVDTTDVGKLTEVARTSLRTKVPQDLADHLADIVVKAVLCIRDPESPNNPLDLHMVEIMHMKHGAATDTRFVDGLVLDHGARHPNMPKRQEKVHLLVCNVSLEYEKSMVTAGIVYNSAEERQRMVAAERKFTDDKVRQIIKFKEEVVGKDGAFVVINANGIDPVSLDLLQKAGIVGIRRAKRRNMERLSKACGGYAVNSLDDLSPDCLGFAEVVHEHQLGDDVYTYVEGCKNSHSCTVLINGPNDHTIAQVKGALRDGLRAVANVIRDQAVVAGAGAFELAAHNHLLKWLAEADLEPRIKTSARVYADALLVVPKTLAQNSGFTAPTTLVELLDEARKSGGKNKVGLDLETGKPMLPESLGIWDNANVKAQIVSLGTMMAVNLLLVDEIMRAGKKMGNKE